MVGRNLRQRVTIQRPAETVASRGQITGEWEDVATRYAQVRKMTGREATASNQLYAQATWRVRLRWERNLSLSVDNRLKYGDVYLLVGSITNVKERNQEFELLCSEVIDG